MRSSAYRILLVVTGSLLITMSWGCGHRELTPKQAAAIIAGTPAFAKPYTIRVILGRHAHCHAVLQPTVDTCLTQYPDVWQYFLARDIGLLAINPIWLADGNATKPAFDVVPIKNAKASPGLKPPQDDTLFPIATRELIAITGIAKIALAGDDLVEVTYAWRWIPSALLEHEQPWRERLGLGERQQSRAILRHAEDGWRLHEELSIAGIREPDLNGYPPNLPAAVVEVVWASPPRDIAESDLHRAASAERAHFAGQGHYVSCISGIEHDPSRGPAEPSADCRTALPGFVTSDGVTLRIDSAPESFAITARRTGACNHYSYVSSDVGAVTEHTDGDDCDIRAAAPTVQR